MKFTTLFNDFLKDVVDLNQSRINTLESRVEAIERFVKESDYDAKIRRFSSQGSWAHKTIIKPANANGEFDADLVIFIDPVDEWEPKDYIEELYSVFRGSARYRSIVRRNSRCITLDYTNDFHLDIVPCIQRDYWLWDDTFHVLNRNTNEEEETAPEDFTNWLYTQNRAAGNNFLRKVIRLVKHQRDVKRTFSAKSILLTTLLGNQVDVGFFPFGGSNDYTDLPTALKTLIGRLDDWLQERELMPTVTNPVLKSEDFNRHWDQGKYENFRRKIHQYREWIDDAYEETDRKESIRKWRRVFGNGFAVSETIDETAASPIRKSDLTSVTTDLVDYLKRGILQLREIPFWPHVQKPKWQKASQQLQVRITATVHQDREGESLGDLTSGRRVGKQMWIRFSASSGLGIPSTFTVYWRVVNSGQAAKDANQMRGGFEKSHSDAIRWEHTEYHGVHWVEAFLVNTRNDKYVGISDRFFVVVD